MKPHWKLIAFEIIFEILVELGPASFSMMAAAAQYLVELSQVDSKASVQLLVGSIGLETNCRGHVIDFALYAFTPISDH